jgi:hypothetical protein
MIPNIPFFLYFACAFYGPVWIHQLNFSWLNLAVRDPNNPAKRPVEV